MTSKSRLISGRVPVTSSANVANDRYQYLDLSSAEPNLGTANSGDILSYDSTTPGGRKWVLPVSVAIYDKQYTKVGVLVPYTDQANRFWPSSNVVINNVIARVGTPSVGQDIQVSVCKNQVPQANITIPQSSNTSVTYSSPILANVGEYISININTVGTLVPGADLYIILKFYKTGT
jgi:hypothetical protein